jgi:hypothetical protein
VLGRNIVVAEILQFDCQSFRRRVQRKTNRAVDRPIDINQYLTTGSPLIDFSYQSLDEMRLHQLNNLNVFEKQRNKN